MYSQSGEDIRSEARVVVVLDERAQQVHVLALLLDRGDHVGEFLHAAAGGLECVQERVETEVG